MKPKYISDKKLNNIVDNIVNVLLKDPLIKEKSIHYKIHYLAKWLCVKKGINNKENVFSILERFRLENNIDLLYNDLFYYHNINFSDTYLKEDVLGYVYQNLLHQDDKKRNGIFYTPYTLVSDILKGYTFTENDTFLEPSCGSGNFVLYLLKEKNIDIEKIYAFDVDEIAVFITKVNILLNIETNSYLTKIQNSDFLQLSNAFFKQIGKINYVVGNPPYGKTDFKNNKLKTTEICSHFIDKSLNISENVILLIPQPILDVKKHKEIRKTLLSRTIKKIVYYKNIMSNVFVNLVTIDVNSSVNIGSNEICFSESNKQSIDKFLNQNILDDEIKYQENDKFLNNDDFLYLDKDKTIFALGLVTGNNKKYISKTKNQKYSTTILTGKEVDSYVSNDCVNFIDDSEIAQYQQVANLDIFKKEKLFYKFINSNLNFSYDNSGLLSLNSANVVIPYLDGYSIKTILAILNSEFINNYWKENFKSIKILKNHILSLPIIKLSDYQKVMIEQKVDEIINEKNISKRLFLKEEISKFVTEKYKDKICQKEKH